MIGVGGNGQVLTKSEPGWVASHHPNSNIPPAAAPSSGKKKGVWMTELSVAGLSERLEIRFFTAR